jgi:hypothetical protein
LFIETLGLEESVAEFDEVDCVAIKMSIEIRRM